MLLSKWIPMPNRVRRQARVICPALLLLAGAAVCAAQPQNLRFNIPAQPLESALLSFSEQARIQLVVADGKIKGLSTTGVQGEYSADDALEMLLKGSGLSYRITDERTIAIGSTGGSKLENEKGAWDRFLFAQAAEPPVAVPAQQGEGNPESVGQEVKLEEIIVTAQKREQRLQDVPISVTVLSGETLDSSTFSGTTDALRTIPGIDTSSDLFSGGTILSSRGVSNGYDVRQAGSGTVAYYIDGVPYGFVRNAFYPNPSIYDLHQIEFLSGPQGTLYGANALNGVLRVLTENANADRFEFKARTSVSMTESGGENSRGDLAINVPIIDGVLAVRATVGFQEESGWIDTHQSALTQSLEGVQPDRRDVNDSSGRNYRLKFHIQPDSSLSINLLAWRSESESGGPNWSDDAGFESTSVPQPTESAFDAYGVEVTKDFGAFSLSSMTSSIDYNQFGIGSGTIVGFPATLIADYNSSVLTQEFNLVSSLQGSWQWSAGLFYRDAEDSFFQLYNIFPSPPPSVNNDFTDNSESYAVYGELSRALTDDLELSLGLRYFHDEGTLTLNKAYGPLPAGTTYESTSEAFTPRVVLNWTPSESQTVYASYSQGFRSGFSQQPSVLQNFPSFIPVDPDTLTNYEVGAKGEAFDGRLSYTGAIFYIDWQDVQQTLGLEDPVTHLISRGVVNGESASGLGAEFAVIATPFDNLELGASVSWNDLRFDADVISGTTILFRAGERMVNSPDYTVGASAQYTFALGGGFNGVFGLTGDYTPKQNPGPVAGPFQGTIVSNDIFISSGRFSLEAPRGWSAVLFVDNLNDERRSPSVASGVPEWSARFRPRTWGLQLEYSFGRR